MLSITRNARRLCGTFKQRTQFKIVFVLGLRLSLNEALQNLAGVSRGLEEMNGFL